jgi:hypothetical protein
MSINTYQRRRVSAKLPNRAAAGKFPENFSA